MTEEIELHIQNWLNYLKKPRHNLGENSICPYANFLPPIHILKKLKVDFIKPLIKNELTIFLETENFSTPDELEIVVRKLNNDYSELVFLPDHPDKSIFIQGLKTSNNKYPCILMQPKKELSNARKKLKKTSYYDYWDKTYLEELLSYDNMD
jgi:hypothetical protein